MRFLVFGAGAIGGLLGARLRQAGHEVALVARGRHLDAIRARGLTLETPTGRSVHAIPAAADPAELAPRAGDVVLLATKSQDTPDALAALRRCEQAEGLAIVCAQNGVENERQALRLFEHVYGAVVMAPAAHLQPGRVEAYAAQRSGLIDVGRYPAGADEHCEAICGALAGAGFESRPRRDVMRAKHAKLLLNLGNAVLALCAAGPERDQLVARARNEGRRVLEVAGIECEDPEVSDLEGRWRRLDVRDIDGRERAGSSSWQSLARGTGSIETDYLNGEIVLVGRLHGVPTPVNAALCEVAARAARERRRPEQISSADILARAA